MPQLNRPRSLNRQDAPFTGEHNFNPADIDAVMGTEAPPVGQTDPIPRFSNTAYSRAVQVKQTEGHQPVVFQNAQTTQSLILALHSTMQPPAKGVRAPIIIPGDRNRQRQRQTAALSLQGGRPGLHPHVRHGLVILASFCVLLFTMFSLTPVGSGQSGIPIFDGAVKWVQTQPLAWNIVGRMDPAPQTKAPAQTNAPAQTTTTTTTANDTNLPQSQYVAIAQADATKYGISPVYFVRQIQQESGFNPYAYSPVGAVGIAQFLPSTAAGLGVNPYDPISALDGAARMMANLSNQYGGNYAKALAGYNAGSGAVDNAVAIGGANWLSYMPAETQNYVAIIMG
ncbi:lytic transglycosylase domain-containing protein [Dictyobacter arantiisoli]|uniref:Transglycosylase SLT domain-containing protein n=1 Tax=Dictyobacter arantiisoli TaxID=2014874 RepID=A0A5A5T8D6_9CHLR|nr:lytic transglycosylase domain-containing protein [Dictyobacter arantiisoli]GCF07426.1 hypothetical protein KDI_09900 [Dictyobacter arantiisoli]